ncbi:MAG: ParB/RepB/Spo0J family partition protein [Clostridiales bacterium]|nr:ParB/RepB/Spo0J family partition protein [Clostridiales bacterium]
MAVKKSGLGRGLDALFADNAAENTSSSSAVRIKLMDIEPNRGQPRKTFDDDSLSELTESISKYGVLQPLLVRPVAGGTYSLVAGERRWRAARLAGLTEVPAVVREMTDDEAAVFSLIENLQREDLNPLEEALGYKKLMDDFSLTQEEAAEKVGKSRPAVANSLRLLKLPQSVLDLVRDGKISAGHARALIPLPNESDMLEVASLIIDKDISVRETERLVKSLLRPSSAPSQKPSRRDAFYNEVELTLSEALGRKIRVAEGKNNTGTLEISFNDKEDLERIAKALGGLEK